MCGLAVFSAAYGATYVVTPDGSGDAPTIQAACLTAATGDTILLANGVYSGDGFRDVDFMGKALILASRNGEADSCIIDLFDQTYRHRAFMILGVAGQPVIRGITIRNGLHEDRGAAIYVSGSSPLIENCKFDHNFADYQGGAIFQGDSGTTTVVDCTFTNNRAQSGAAVMARNADVILERCLFRDNRATSLGGAVAVVSARGTFVEDCWFESNVAIRGGAFSGSVCQVILRGSTFLANRGSDGGGAVYLYAPGAWGVYSRLRNCTLVGNRSQFGSCLHVVPNTAALLSLERSLLAFGQLGGAIHASAESVPILEYCDLFGNEGGDWTGAVADQFGQKGNIWADPLFCDADQADLRLFDISACLPANNEYHVQIGAHGKGCLSEGYIVYPDGSGILPDIQAGVATTPDGGMLELADGVFTGPGNRNIDLLGKQITIRSQSGNPDACIIDCEGNIAEPHRGFVLRSGEGAGTVLENLTVRNGYATDHGGALLVLGASPTIRNCRFLDCIAAQFGGAIAVTAAGAPVVIDCLLAHSNAIFGGGLYAAEGAQPSLLGCSLIANGASLGGGIASVGASIICDRTLVVSNQGGGAAALLLDGQATFTCSDLYGNLGGDWTEGIADQFPGNGNRSDDPCFCDPPAGLYTLCADSWCLPANDPDGCGELIGALGAGCDACDCQPGTATVVAGFRVQPHVDNTGSYVTASWQVLIPATPADFLLVAQRQSQSWRVLHQSDGAGRYEAADRHASLKAGDQLSYLLQFRGGTGWKLVAKQEVTLPDTRLLSHLQWAAPNPFNPRTTVAFTVGRPQPVELAVFDLEGRRVAVLVDGVMAAGSHVVTWDGTGTAGEALSTGVYLVCLRTQGETDTTKIVLMR